MNKQLANWIYWEDGDNYYCADCIEIRTEEINENKEFSDNINYNDGERCGYIQDYANEEYQVFCCRCSNPLFSLIDTQNYDFGQNKSKNINRNYSSRIINQNNYRNMINIIKESEIHEGLENKEIRDFISKTIQLKVV